MLQYSVAISPPETVLAQVQQLKQQLRAAIGWYSSVNAQAHITFNIFRADAEALAQWETYMETFAASQSPISLQFRRTDAFANGAFFLAPDEASELLLITMMQDFHQYAPRPADQQSIKPHMSIARRLTADQLAVARALIPGAAIHFTCSDLVLRRFNENRKQYDIYRRSGFGIKT